MAGPLAALRPPSEPALLKAKCSSRARPRKEPRGPAARSRTQGEARRGEPEQATRTRWRSLREGGRCERMRRSWEGASGPSEPRASVGRREARAPPAAGWRVRGPAVQGGRSGERGPGTAVRRRQATGIPALGLQAGSKLEARVGQTAARTQARSGPRHLPRAPGAMQQLRGTRPALPSPQLPLPRGAASRTQSLSGKGFGRKNSPVLGSAAATGAALPSPWSPPSRVATGARPAHTAQHAAAPATPPPARPRQQPRPLPAGVRAAWPMEKRHEERRRRGAGDCGGGGTTHPWVSASDLAKRLGPGFQNRRD